MAVIAERLGERVNATLSGQWAPFLESSPERDGRISAHSDWTLVFDLHIES
jgi:hypothetical protein